MECRLCYNIDYKLVFVFDRVVFWRYENKRRDQPYSIVFVSCTCFGRLLTTGVGSGMYYAENMTEDNPGSSGEMCQDVSGRRLVRPTSTYTAARDALTLAHCVCVAVVLTLRQVMHDKCN